MKRLSSPKENSAEKSIQMQSFEMDLLHEAGKKQTNKQTKNQNDLPFFVHTTKFEKHCIYRHGTI